MYHLLFFSWVCIHSPPRIEIYQSWIKWGRSLCSNLCIICTLLLLEFTTPRKPLNTATVVRILVAFVFCLLIY
jgi:hypothetical protein